MNACKKEILLRGLRTAWLEQGNPQSPLMLLLHGFPDGPEVWEGQAEYFSKFFQVIRPYGRGVEYSQSSKELKRYGIDSLCLDYIELLDFVDPKRERPIVLMGHDLGVAQAWRLASYLTSRLSALIVVNGPSFKQFLSRWKNPRQLLKSWYMLAMQVPGLAEWAFGGKWNLQFRRFAYASGGLVSQKYAPLLGNNNTAMHAFNQYRAFFRDIPRQWSRESRRIEAPTLVLCGAKDRFLEPSRLDELHQECSNVSVRILNANHWIQLECAGEFDDLVKQFIEEKTCLNLQVN